MKTYRIEKKYIGHESCNNLNYEAGLSYEDAIAYLNATEINWLRNGGSVNEKTDEYLEVEEGDGSHVITFEIFEE
jgi:hypothetical protein